MIGQNEMNERARIRNEYRKEISKLEAQNKELREALKAIVDHFHANDEAYWASDLCTDSINVLRKTEGKE